MKQNVYKARVSPNSIYLPLEDNRSIGSSNPYMFFKQFGGVSTMKFNLIDESRPIVKDATAIYELLYSLENICGDDGIEIHDAEDWYIYDEAVYVLKTFYEDGHIRNMWLIGEDGDPKEAKKEVKALKQFIKKYEYVLK